MRGNSNVSQNDVKVLRELAKRYMEIAQMDVMPERKRLWKDLHDLKPQRPMIIFEPFWLDGYLDDYKLRCEDNMLQNVEKRMMFAIRQFEEMDDDIVIEPYFRIAWWGPELVVTGKDFGEIKIEEHQAKVAGLAYLSNFPIKTPDDIKRLTPRTFKVDKKPTLEMKDKLENIFGDILPIKLGNFDNFDFDLGNQPFTGNNFIGVTWDLFKLIGTEKIMTWVYDHPDALHTLCRFLVDDKKRFYQFLKDEKLLDFNTDNQFAGPSCYGYVSDLPACDTDREVELKDCWTWPESQETECMSPKMFAESFLPYIAEIANMFGLSYYGCCERMDDRFPYVKQAIKNLRIVSVSHWNDFKKAGELLGKDYVYSRKPTPAYVSGETANWDLVEKEAIQTRDATKNGCLEIICRDVYSSKCTPARAKEWIKMWKNIVGI
ncbi:MAG: hypothetical protein M1308_17340 [Actinobacteria bacterium]|nr:hypothetical protein [Actinomycetota bacterium]